MADRTGFEHDLAEAVAAATRDVRLAAPGEVIRLGRRRARARRGRMAVAGIAVLGGAYGAVGLAGEATAPKPVTASPAATTGAHGSGLLPVEQWPWDSTQHWKVTKGTTTYFGVAPWMISTVDDSPPNGPGATFYAVGCAKKSVPDMNAYLAGKQRATVQGWETAPRGKVPPYPPNAGETIYTYTDTADAQRALTDTKEALKQPCSAGWPTLTHGASTDYGVSWTMRTSPAPNDDAALQVLHEYLVVEGDRVAELGVSQDGDAFASTADDAKILAAMRDALAR